MDTTTVYARTREYCTNLRDETDMQKDVFAMCKTILEIRIGECKNVCELPTILGDVTVKQKFQDVHWDVLSRGLSFILSERPTAHEAFNALQNGTPAAAPPPVSPQMGPAMDDDFFI